MKNRLIINLLWLGAGLYLCRMPASAQCGPGSIALKSSNRDWVGDFEKIARSRVAISPLKSYFYTGDKPRDCLSPSQLQALSAALQQLDTKGNADARALANVVAGVARKNPPTTAVTATGPASASNDPTAATGPATVPTTGKPTTQPTGTEPVPPAVAPTDAELMTALETKQTQLTENRDFWRMLAYALGGLSVLLGGLAAWFRAETKQKLYEQRERHRQVMDETTLRHSRDMDGFRDTMVGKLETKYTEKYPAKTTAPNPANPTRPFTDKSAPANTFNRSKDPAPSPELPALPVPELMAQTPGGSDPATAPAMTAPAAADPIPAQPVALPVAPTFFLSIPTATPDGTTTFLDRRQTQFNPSSSVYRFQLTDDTGEQAKFRFVSEPGPVEGALNYPDTYLRPACDYKSLNTKAKQIVTDTPGVAILTGDVWRVERKAVVRFV
jgi:hypothetical protein